MKSPPTTINILLFLNAIEFAPVLSLPCNIGNNIFPLNANKAQGYWAFGLNNQPYSTSGQAAAGATTVPNPISSTSTIPPGSCVVTGEFSTPFTITGNETEDVVIVVSLSTNNSFEWKENGGNNLYEPAAGDTVVDMGIRGLIPIVQ